MIRYLAASVALTALGLAAGAACAQPAPHHYTLAHNVTVRLPPGPCIDAGGRIDHRHHDACIVPLVVFEPLDSCRHDHGVMVETNGSRRGCAMRDPQSGLPTGQRTH
jgi:hypothetical protein